MEKIAIVGAGLIGRAWAVVFARAGRQVTFFDPDPEVASRASARIRVSLDDLAEAGLIDEPATAIAARIAPAPTLAATVAGADYVQENSPERLDLKIALYADLDRLAPAGAILASSSSGLPASAFSEPLAGRARCLVAHPVNPPHLLPLVEISPAPWTSPGIVARTRALHEAVGQSPIVIRREVDGFVLNRLQGALLAEAFRLVEDGYVSTADVDKTLKDGLGLRWSFMGPFETIDLNAPGGVRDYVDRYGSLYYEMAKSQADPRPWSLALVDKIEAERRAELPTERLLERQRWRDRRLMALLAHKRAAARRKDY
ncbi:MAG TPA: 3-hydroxyacyl-CoA dehydrogenase [Alphaproteobacteria bacterium]|nr:3-hydroxyacyl-CoA dehydrogenase [Alphaproteobacteria bacterium]